MTATLDLDAIEARCNAATPGPWEISYGCEEESRYRWRAVGPPHEVVENDAGYDDGSAESASEDDAKFIAHARTDVPLLIAEVRRLRAALRRIGDDICRPECGGGCDYECGIVARIALAT